MLVSFLGAESESPGGLDLAGRVKVGLGLIRITAGTVTGPWRKLLKQPGHYLTHPDGLFIPSDDIFVAIT